MKVQWQVNVLVTREFLHGTHVAMREIERRCDGEMPDAVRTNDKSGLQTQSAHDVIDGGSSQTARPARRRPPDVPASAPPWWHATARLAR